MRQHDAAARRIRSSQMRELRHDESVGEAVETVAAYALSLVAARDRQEPRGRSFDAILDVVVSDPRMPRCRNGRSRGGESERAG